MVIKRIRQAVSLIMNRIRFMAIGVIANGRVVLLNAKVDSEIRLRPIIKDAGAMIGGCRVDGDSGGSIVVLP